MNKALCFIFNKSYSKQGSEAINSARRYNPDHRIILLTDLENKIADIQIKPQDIGLDNKHWLLIGRVAILEFTLKSLNFDTAILVDGDTYSYNSFDDLQGSCENHSMVVIPHITKPLPEDNKFPQNRIISLSGNYNAGIVGTSKKALEFISWWKYQTALYPITRSDMGLVNEQGWLRFAGDFDDNTKIFRHPGYNVAYWNIKQRNVYIENDILKIDNENLCIVHYSGLKLETLPEHMSVFQNRYTLDKSDVVYKLFKDYHDLIWNKQ
jgi:hypothetical protein